MPSQFPKEAKVEYIKGDKCIKQDERYGPVTQESIFEELERLEKEGKLEAKEIHSCFDCNFGAECNVTECQEKRKCEGFNSNYCGWQPICEHTFVTRNEVSDICSKCGHIKFIKWVDCKNDVTEGFEKTSEQVVSDYVKAVESSKLVDKLIEKEKEIQEDFEIKVNHDTKIINDVLEKIDPVNHPSHYTQGPKCPYCNEPIECITITEDRDFCIGNAIKYLWRSKHKGKELEDLKKAKWYIERKIRNLEKGEDKHSKHIAELPRVTINSFD